MLAIGRALLTTPQLLIMDEPSEGLAPAIVERHDRDLCKTLVEEGMAILLVEQNLGVATSVAERQLVMVAGRIAAETTAAALVEDAEAQRRYLGVEPLASCRRRPVTTVVLVGNARHEGGRVRLPRRPDPRARRRRRARRRGDHGRAARRPDVTREEVARAAGADVAALAAAGDRGAAVETMARGAAEVVKRLHAEGRLDAIGGLGGSGGSALVTHAMRALRSASRS